MNDALPSATPRARRLAALCLGTAIALVAPAIAAAQDVSSGSASASPAPEQTIDATDAGGDDIVVTGIRAGLEKSINVKRKAVNVVDVISAEDIGKFPDNNLAESLQRIPSVTIDRSELGEGRQINLRGLGTGFTRTEINGGFAINGLDLGVLAPEIFSRVAVEKSSSASSVEGGLAGTVKIETIKPFDSPGLRIVGVAGGASASTPASTFTRTPPGSSIWISPDEHGAGCGVGTTGSATCTSSNTGNDGTARASLPSRNCLRHV